MIVDQTLLIKNPQFTAWFTQTHAANGERQIAIQIGDDLNLILTPTELGVLAATIAETLRLPASQDGLVEVVSVPLV
jgi:hypothetical protein